MSKKTKEVITEEAFKAALGSYTEPQARKIIMAGIEQGLDLCTFGEGSHYSNHVLAVAILLCDKEMINSTLEQCRAYHKKTDLQHPVINLVTAWENTALALAIKIADYKLAMLLINEFDADVNQVFGQRGLTPLSFCVGILGGHYNTEYAHKDEELFHLIELLLQNEANQKAEVDTPTHDTPLDILKLKMKKDDYSGFMHPYPLADYGKTRFKFTDDHVEKIIEIRNLKWLNKPSKNSDKKSRCRSCCSWFFTTKDNQQKSDKWVAAQLQRAALIEEVPHYKAFKTLEKEVKAWRKITNAIFDDESMTIEEQFAMRDAKEAAARHSDHAYYEAQLFFDNEKEFYDANELIEAYGEIPNSYTRTGLNQSESSTPRLLNTNIQFFNDTQDGYNSLTVNRNAFFETELGQRMFAELEEKLMTERTLTI